MSRTRHKNYCPNGKRNCHAGCSHADKNAAKAARHADVGDFDEEVLSDREERQFRDYQDSFE